MFNKGWLIGLLVAAVFAAGWAFVDEPILKRSFVSEFAAVNDSGVSGTAWLWVEGETLTVSIDVKGLEPDVEHPLYINGFEDIQVQALCPHAGADADGDGIISDEEARFFHGEQLFELKPFDKADSEGKLIFEATYEFEADTLEPLELRSIVLHGLIVDDVYEEKVPVACGRITIVEPAIAD